jgi:hypothetical protein
MMRWVAPSKALRPANIPVATSHHGEGCLNPGPSGEFFPTLVVLVLTIGRSINFSPSER